MLFAKTKNRQMPVFLCPWKDGTVKQGFRNAKLLAFCLMNAIRYANGKMQVLGTQSFSVMFRASLFS